MNVGLGGVPEIIVLEELTILNQNVTMLHLVGQTFWVIKLLSFQLKILQKLKDEDTVQ